MPKEHIVQWSAGHHHKYLMMMGSPSQPTRDHWIAIIICTPKFPAGQTAPHKNKLTAFKFDRAPVNCEFPRWEGLRLFGLDFHGASVDIIADQQVDNLHFELA